MPEYIFYGAKDRRKQCASLADAVSAARCYELWMYDAQRRDGGIGTLQAGRLGSWSWWAYIAEDGVTPMLRYGCQTHSVAEWETSLQHLAAAFLGLNEHAKYISAVHALLVAINAWVACGMLTPEKPPAPKIEETKVETVQLGYGYTATIATTDVTRRCTAITPGEGILTYAQHEEINRNLTEAISGQAKQGVERQR